MQSSQAFSSFAAFLPKSRKALQCRALVWRQGTIPALQSPMCEYRLRHLCNQQIQRSHTITADSLAHPRGFEPPTCRLGGGRSILLSYGCVCSSIVPKKYGSVNENPAHFLLPPAYNGKITAEGSGKYGKIGSLLGCGRLHLCRPGLATQRKIILTL